MPGCRGEASAQNGLRGGVFCCDTPLAPVAEASFDVLTIYDEPFSLEVTAQERWEAWNWFGPGNVRNRHDDNRYHLLGGWTQLGPNYHVNGVGGYLQLMSPVLLHLPIDASAPPPQGPLGLGANYFNPHRTSCDASVFIHQGFIEFGGASGLRLKGGRFEFADGAEFLPDEPALKWLAINRIQQRLVGMFGLSDATRSFDGAMASYSIQKWNATIMYGVPTKGAFEIQE